MTRYTVKQSGGDYPTLNAALVAVSASDEISIEGAWTIADTTAAAIVDDNLLIETDAYSRHPGYWDESQNHYRLVVGATHALTLNGAYTLTLDGLAISQSGTGTSYESFRCVPGTSDTVTAKNCLLRCSTNTSQQDCIYTGFQANIGTITLENCLVYGAARAGVNVQNFYNDARSGTVNINSCVFWNNGRDPSPSDAEVGGGVIAVANNLIADGSSFTINVHNTISVENDTGGSGASQSPADYNDIVIDGIGVGAFNVSYSIDSDGSIATETDGGTGNLASRTATDNTSPGGGDWVIFEDITTTPYDLRIVDNAENDAQDMHSTAVAHGLTIPSTDIVGTGRPWRTSFDCGAFEIKLIIAVRVRRRYSQARPLTQPKMWDVDPGIVEFQFRYLWKNIISAFALWEHGGSLLYDVGRNRGYGTIVNTPWVSGAPGLGLSFDQVSGRYVDIPVDPEPARITVLCYCVKTGANNSDNYHIVSNWGSWGLRRLRGASGGENTAPTFTVTVGASEADAIGPAGSFPQGQPVVLVGRWDGSEASLWIDGVKRASDTSLSGDLDTGGAGYRIGAYGGGSGLEFDGDVYEVVVFDRALTDQEITGISADPFGLFRKQPRVFPVSLPISLPAEAAIRPRRRHRQDQAFGRPFRLNKHSPQAKGLGGWWPTLGQKGNRLNDYSEYSNNGVFPGGTLNPSWITDAERVRVLSFDGDDDYVQVLDPSNGSLDPSQLTFTAWVKRNGSQATFRRFVNKSDGGGSSGYQIFTYSTTNRLGCYLENGGTNSGDVDSGWLIPDSVWALIAVTYDGSNIRFYGNGVLRNTIEYVGGIGNSAIAARFGTNHNNDRNFNGRIDDIRIYNRVLTDSEVYQLYAPQTRWDLCEPLPRVFPVLIPAVDEKVTQMLLFGGRKVLTPRSRL